MPITSFYSLLADGRELYNMPPVEISERSTDIKDVYNKNTARLDYWAGKIYQDETLWRLIMWANPEYELEYDIPDNTIIRIPFPKGDVIQEVIGKINSRKNVY